MTLSILSAVDYLALYVKWPALSEHHAHRIIHHFIYTTADKGGDTNMPQSERNKPICTMYAAISKWPQTELMFWPFRRTRLSWRHITPPYTK